MSEYLNYTFNDTDEFVNTLDELPLWSAPFGLLLLKHLELAPNLTVLDIGSGTGFPLTELAERLGKSCKLYGLDIWKNANVRAKQKIRNYELSNVDILENSGSNISFEDNSVDLIVSNLGINNFENPQKVFQECFRVLKPCGKLVLTTNLNGHWHEFYTVFEESLLELGKIALLDNLRIHQEHRGTVVSLSKLFSDSGFNVSKYFEESFEMKFVDGSAFLNHHFVKLGWLSSWIELLPKNEVFRIFDSIEKNLNSLAHLSGGLKLNVPMAYIQGEKL